ncbi:MAG: non-canonical purine NTP pyrophosphatase [Coriobacteriales bacterium]|jgi:XTP/dITP diphosphohydrolase|nr:non-canonical purine NTP pyrophosphatase [Coriobacteriales bacterium]
MERFQNTVLVASRNKGKIPEIVESLDLADWQFIPLSAYDDTPSPAETGTTYEENARIKAWAARTTMRSSEKTPARPSTHTPAHPSTRPPANTPTRPPTHTPANTPATLADDSGLEVDALGGAPGIHSARFGGEGTTDERNVERLLAALKAVSEAERRARFICCVVYVDEEGHEIVSQGVCEGRIADAPRGAGGFGYDPVFLPDEIDDGRTMAELTPEEKGRLSHRGKALRALREELIVHYDLETQGGKAR